MCTTLAFKLAETHVQRLIQYRALASQTVWQFVLLAPSWVSKHTDPPLRAATAKRQPYLCTGHAYLDCSVLSSELILLKPAVCTLTGAAALKDVSDVAKDAKDALQDVLRKVASWVLGRRLCLHCNQPETAKSL